jgi:glycosyltransferase involved in cell wall biosynthesis
MRVLVTLHNFLPERCFGAERVAIRHMRELRQSGHDVAVLFAGRRDPSAADLAREGLADVRCFRVPYVAPRAQVLLSIARPRAEAAFGRALDGFRPDVVFFHHLVRLSLRLPEIARRRGCPSVLFIHDHYLVCPSYSLVAFDEPVCAGGSPSRCARCLYAVRFGRRVPPGIRGAASLLLAARERIVARAVAAVDGVIAPSRSVLAEIAARGVRRPDAVVCRNGCDAPEVRVPLAPRAREVRFGYLGAMLPKKGVAVLAEACRGPLSRRLTMRGFEDERAMAAFRSAHPECAATLQPFASDPAAFLRGVDVVVVPSVWLENQPSVIIEAFAEGRPVVASRIGGIPEMFEDGHGGWLLPPGDAEALRACLTRLHEAPDEISRVAAGIPQWPSWAEAGARVARELERAIDRAPAGPPPARSGRISAR